MIAVSLLLLTGGVLGGQSILSASPPGGPPFESLAGETRWVASNEVLEALEGRLGAIYDQVTPSVVNIQVVQKAESPDFFAPSPDVPQEFYRQGGGSGFVWDQEGHIVTNNHVVADADKISVTFHDGTIVLGEIVGTDPSSDLAVIKVDVLPARLQPVEMADSSQVSVGELSVAIGNPFGLEGTMTVGFVSALGRLLPVAPEAFGGPGYSIPDVVQTDTPINPGNSGGVLVDDEARVIGVTSAIISPIGVSAGIGFAIPSNIVQKVVPVLIEIGHYDHPWLGISATSLNPDLAQTMGLDLGQRGVLVANVVPGGPADQAGLRGSDRQVEIDGRQVRVGGDVVVAIDGESVQDFDDLIAYLARATEVGQEVSLSVLRDGVEQTLQVTLAARPKLAVSQDQGRAEAQWVKDSWLGVRGQTITPHVAQAIGLPRNQTGVLVEQIEVDSPADQAGLRGSYKPVFVEGERLLIGGDVITALDEVPVAQISDLQTLAIGQEMTLTILRDGEELAVPVTPTERPGTPAWGSAPSLSPQGDA
jgi:S1-C subfamily serine protease